MGCWAVIWISLLASTSLQKRDEKTARRQGRRNNFIIASIRILQDGALEEAARPVSGSRALGNIQRQFGAYKL
ncbi:hypothetical protein F5144DRAFT_556900, partial [Chaetomium tenue]